MKHITKSLIVSAIFLVASVGRAQTTVDPSGHWEGSLALQNAEMAVQFDLARNSSGGFAGTISLPSESLKGMPLTRVAVNGAEVTLEIKTSGGGTFVGTLDGNHVISGTFSGAAGSTTFAVARKGDAQIAEAPKGLALPRDLEGTWQGTLTADGRALRIVVTMANGPDGRSTGTAMSVDEGGLELPLVVTEVSETLAFAVPAAASTFSGTLDVARTEITGTYQQRGFRLPLVLRKASIAK